LLTLAGRRPFYGPCATRSGPSQCSGQPCPRVATFSSRFWLCTISWAYSGVGIDASARLTVYSGCVCDGGGLVGRKLSCWSSRPPSPVGSEKGSVDAGAVGGLDDHASPQNFERSLGAWPQRIGSGAPADSWRVVEARIHRLGTHGVPISSRPTDETVADLADLPRKSRRQPGGCLDSDPDIRDEH
jgi:hypothetical protein